MLARVLLAVIPLAWLSVLALFAALCRTASYGDAQRNPARPHDW